MAIIKRTLLYDGARHFLFILPPLAILTGATLGKLLDLCHTILPQKIYRGLYGGLALCLVFHITTMWQLHPYEYIYYNNFIGSVAGASASHYPSDYWLTSYREAINRLIVQMKTTYGPDFDNITFRIFVSHHPECATLFFPKNFILSSRFDDSDFRLISSRDGKNTMIPGDSIFKIERQGAVLAEVKRNINLR